MRAFSILVLAVALALGPTLGCKRDEPPAVAVAARLWVAPVADEHPWVIAFLTELSITRPPGVDARLEGRTEPDGRYVPDPVFETTDTKLLAEQLQKYEQLHPRPPELEPIWEYLSSGPEGRPVWRLHFIDKQAGFVLDGGASASLDPSHDVPLVKLKFSPAQGERFAALTRAYVGRRIAFTFDDELVNVPIVREEIPGGEVMLRPDSSGVDPELAAQSLLERLQQPN